MVKISRQKSPDRSLTIVVFALIIFGLVMISSASAINSYQNFGVTSVYFWRQAIYIIVSLIAWPIIQSIDYRRYRKLAFPIIITSIALLIAIFIPGVGTTSGTVARSWINLGITTIQPAELAKLGLIIYLADFFARKGNKIQNFSDGFLPFLAVVGVICGLIALQPDFGTIMIIAVIAASIYFASGASLTHFLLLFVMGFLGMLTVVQNKTYVLNRFIAFLSPETIDPEKTGYHIRQALIAIGSGGFWGVGFGNSRQKFGYLPEAHGDSIFPVAAEELGFIRMLPLILTFLFIAIKGYQIAKNAPDKFGRLVAVGITTWLAFQAFINMAVNLSLFPTTGVPLPFISQGGSSLISLVVGTAILINISKYSHAHSSSRWWYGRSYRTRPVRNF